MQVLLSVDPGKTGALAIFESGELVRVHDAGDSLSRRFAGVLLDYLDFRHQVKVVIERVNGVPGQSGPASFNFGQGFGELLGVCIGLGVEPVLITPATWKWKMNLRGLGKHASVLEAARRWGSEFFHLKKHDGRAEAALLGACWLEDNPNHQNMKGEARE
jgi:hypothetical protein